MAARQLKLTLVPVIRVEHLSEAQRWAYAIADNKIAENAGWDDDLLRIEITALTLNNEIDIDLTGFSTPS